MEVPDIRTLLYKKLVSSKSTQSRYRVQSFGDWIGGGGGRVPGGKYISVSSHGVAKKIVVSVSPESVKQKD
jgi:hypothetical protein